MASSSSSQIWIYDVFLSFRGEDTRKTIVSHLHKALVGWGITTFKDDRKLLMGDYIPTKLCEAIRTSRLAVVVISENYADSGWCLDELKLIMDLADKNEVVVVPIFYEVDPSDVRNQRGKFSLTRYQRSARADSVAEWTHALRGIGNRKGTHSTKWEDEATMTEDVVRLISSRLSSMLPLDLGYVVGMEAHMESLGTLMDTNSKSEEARMIGIWGMGGTGKTTIAQYLYENFKHQFSPRHCFIHNIRVSSAKDGILDLQEQLISTILGETPTKLWSVERGAQLIQSRFRNLKVFIVLDDVNDRIQLSYLAKEARWFGPGSRIVITTRDKRLLTSSGVEILYNVECLNKENSLQLFQHIAFEETGGHPPSDVYEDLVHRVSRLSQGLPLALQAFARHLRGKTLLEWQRALESFEGSPYENITRILRISYDGLDEPDKAAFLHIACLFNGDPLSRVESLLHRGEVGINALVEKSLINISADKSIAMHVLVEQTGRKIVCQESGNEPAKQRILWQRDNILPVLKDKTGTTKIEGLALDAREMPRDFQIEWNVFEQMHNLCFLNIYKHTQGSKSKKPPTAENLLFLQKLRLLHWDAYPYTALPSGSLPAGCLVELNLCYSKLRSLWHGNPAILLHLRRLDLTGSKDLKELPNLNEAVCLEELILEGCISLKQIPESIFRLPKLTKLDLSNCDGLKNVKTIIWESDTRRSLRIRSVHLDVLGPTPFEEESRENSLTHLSTKGELRVELKLLKGDADTICFISDQQIPQRMMMLEKQTQNLTSPPYGFKSLEIMRFDRAKKSDPFKCYSFSDFPWLTELNLINLNIEEIPDDIRNMQALEKLDLSGNDFKGLPTSLTQLSKLKHVTLCNCRKLEALPPLYQLETLRLSDCVNLRTVVSIPCPEQGRGKYSLLEFWLDNCKKVESLSDQICQFTKLTYLDISRHEFETLPTSIKDLTWLVTLCLNYCKKLKSLAELPLSLKFLYAHGCKSLDTSSIPSRHPFHHRDLSSCVHWRQEFSHIIRFPAGRRSEEVPVCACFKTTKILNTYIQVKSPPPSLWKRLKPW